MLHTKVNGLNIRDTISEIFPAPSELLSTIGIASEDVAKIVFAIFICSSKQIRTTCMALDNCSVIKSKRMSLQMNISALASVLFHCFTWLALTAPFCA